MKINRHCIICQINALGKTLAGLDLTEEQKFAELRKICAYYASCDAGRTPPETYIVPWERLVELNGGADPLKESKRADDELGMSLLPMIQAEIDASGDPFMTAMRYAIAANILDPLPQQHGMTMEQVLKETVRSPMFVDDSAELRRRLEKAKSVLYMTDNAGEVAVDRLFIETLYKLGLTSPDKVTVAVRGYMANNDAIMEDAERVGLTGVARVIGNGDDSMGVTLSRCSSEFKEALSSADVIISKGMGNFECLNDWREKPVFYLFITKCAPVAEASASPMGSFVCMLYE